MRTTEMDVTQINENTCWCEECKDKIPKGERYMRFEKRGWNARVPSRINVCKKCILRAI